MPGMQILLPLSPPGSYGAVPGPSEQEVWAALGLHQTGDSIVVSLEAAKVPTWAESIGINLHTAGPAQSDPAQ